MTDEWWSLAIAAVIWAAATFMIIRGAMLGARKHSHTRLFLGAVSGISTALYTLDLFNVVSHSLIASILRANSWLVGLSLIAVSWSGIKFGLKIAQIVQTMEGMSTEAQETRGDG